MFPISRQEALQIGLKHYFTGKPCKHGHISKRFSSNRVCVQCHAAESIVFNEIRREGGYFERYRKANVTKEKQNQWARKHRERNRKRSRQRHRSRRQMIRAATIKCPRDALKRDELYLEARRLTLETGRLHVVDHIVPIKHDKVCGLHVSHNLRVIESPENLRKSNKFEV